MTTVNKTQKGVKIYATATRKFKGKSSGIAEISIDGLFNKKYVDLYALKELAGASRVNQTKLMESWLNTEEGTKWAKETPRISNFF